MTTIVFDDNDKTFVAWNREKQQRKKQHFIFIKKLWKQYQQRVAVVQLKISIKYYRIEWNEMKRKKKLETKAAPT